LGKGVAASLGFPAEQVEQIGLVVTELATNLIKHAAGGRLQFNRVENGDRTGIEIQSIDRGPGIADIERALTDRYSTAGGLGLGLGTVNRLMDELEIHSTPGHGVHVVCRRWVRTAHSAIVWDRLDFGVATRSCRQAPENGDTFVFKQWNEFALVGVIDGLGHGPHAQHASHAARQYIEAHFDQPLRNVFQGAGRACQGTRGVVMALARVDFSRRVLTVASVGNIETRLVGGPEKLDLMVRRGIVGLNAPDAVPAELRWTAEGTLIMHSDGLSTRWDWNEYQHLESSTPEVIARRMLADLGKIEDDATVIVARSARS
jgi:anti-sigma regulatory factor (Ser/Thr protein kinase)